jgi:hypothetical protein
MARVIVSLDIATSAARSRIDTVTVDSSGVPVERVSSVSRTTQVEGPSARCRCPAAGSTTNDRRVVSSLDTRVPGVNRASAEAYDVAGGRELDERPARNA